MNYQGGFETFKEATRYMFQTNLTDILLVLFGLVASVAILVALPYTISRYLTSRSARKEFEVIGKQMGLNEEEIALLYKCASTLEDPNKVFHNKYVFEKCAGKLVKESSDNIPIIVSVRKKLKFEHLPWFLPLATTRDIEVYQTGFISYKGKSYDAAVWEKTEEALKIAILDRVSESPQPGEKVRFSFLREDDGRYYFEAEVLNTYIEGGKVILVIPHTEKLGKVQLRNSVRWKVSILARVLFFNRKVKAEELSLIEELAEESFLEGTIENISTEGVKVCFNRFVSAKEGNSLLLEFEWKGKAFKNILAEIRYISGSTERTCFGLKFLNLKKDYEDTIRKFIIEEQREALKTYKMDR
ncbi:MAG: PilZ domain-containing protein [Thermocrinis sp.]|nr:PilZ domain-containing protein [Thermocrinis sp.]